LDRPVDCGKTTSISVQVKRAVEKYGPTGALVVSLTKAAAVEAAGKIADTLAEGMVGTLHSQCYRALGSPTVIKDVHIEEWNTRHPAFKMSFDGKRGESDETGRKAVTEPGDELLAEANLRRVRMVDRKFWPDDFGFFDAWTAFKEDLNVIDYTDMIEMAHRRVPFPPGGPSVIFADEAQDLSKLETSLLAKWCHHVDHVVLTGDMEQALFSFRGSDPDALSEGENKILHRVLGSKPGEASYRVPREVHGVAVRMIQRCDYGQHHNYNPRDAEGSVIKTGASFKDGSGIVSHVKEALSDGGDAMVIAPCGYMLNDVIAKLRAAGIPYWNKYSPDNYVYNPLTPRKGVSSAKRFMGFLRADSLADFKLFMPLMATCRDNSGAILHGGKKKIEDMPENVSQAEATRAIREAFRPDALKFLARPDGHCSGFALQWFYSNLTKEKQRSMEYVLNIYDRGGIKELSAQPRCIVGTVHSVKGGQAGTVIVCPDLSMRGWDQFEMRGWENRDAIYRMMYVAMTRAKERLILAQPSNKFYVPW
jgi:superfamily I DNA/RNA helicase